MAKSKKKRQQLAFFKDIPPVTPLPPELLWVIFHLVKSNRSDTSPISVRPPSDAVFAPELQWIPETTHICRHWRATALADPSLWAEIYVSASNRWATEFLARSKESRNIRITSDMTVEAVVSGSAEARRKTNLKLCRTILKKYMDRVEGVKFTGVDVAQLQSLLTVDREDEVIQGLKEFAVAALPEYRDGPVLIAARQDMPFNPTNLSRFDLEDCVFTNWDALKRFYNLTHLRLHFIRSWALEMTPRELQEALNVMPRLQQLDIGIEGFNHGDRLEDAQAVTDQVVLLPKLCSVKLYHPDVGWVRQILQNITTFNEEQAPMDRQCAWDIGTADSDEESWSNGGLFTTLSERIISPNNISFLQIQFINKELRYERRRGVIFSLWPLKERTGHCRGGLFSLPLVQYEALADRFGALDRGTEGMESLAVFRMLFDPRGYDNLTTLKIMGETSFPDPEDLADTIGRLPQLRKVTLGMKDWRAELGSFFLALSFGDETHVIPFAALESIHVEGSLSIDVQTEREILEGLRSRYLRGFPIEQLELPLENPKAGYFRDVDALKKVVGTLVIVNKH